MPASEVVQKLLDFLKRAPSEYPKLTGTTLGAATGGAAGGLFSEEGATGRGVMQGALLGGGAGLGAGALRELPLVPAALSAGIPIGWMARRKLSPLRAEELREQREERKRLRIKEELEEDRKKAKASGWPEGLEKTEAHNSKYKENPLMSAQENLKFLKEAVQQNQEGLEKDAERLLAFDVGMEVFCEANGITKEAMAQAVGLEPEELAAETVAYLSQQAEQVAQ